jgi:hypothetical protein
MLIAGFSLLWGVLSGINFVLLRKAALVSSEVVALAVSLACALIEAFVVVALLDRAAPRRTNPRGSSRTRPPSNPDFVPPSAVRLVQAALDYRIDAEAESLSRLRKLPPGDYARLVDDLDALLEKMRRTSGDQFRELDVQFHRRIAEAAHNAPADLANAFAFNTSVGGLVASIENHREAIVIEHQRIVDALRKQDLDEAADASRRHLLQVRQRWCPDYDIKVKTANPTFYAPLGPGGALLWSGMVYPLEWVKDWPTLGKAAAAAVGRGAQLWYFAFAQSLIDRWRGKGLKLDVPDLTDMQEKFSRFQCRIAQDLQALAGSPEKALQLVQQRVFLVFLDDDSLFHLTRIAQTLGYYMYPDRRHVLTQRVSLSESVAWYEIEEISYNNDDCKKHFLTTLEEALEKLRDTAGNSREGQLAAGCLGKMKMMRLGPDTPTLPPASLEKTSHDDTTP